LEVFFIKRILYIADTVPFPYNTGGKLRTANIMMQLKKEYDIDFMVYSTEPVEPDQINQMSQHCSHVECFDEGVPSKIKRICNFLSMKSNKAFVVYSKNMQQAIDNLISSKNYSFIIIERLYCYQYIGKYVKRNGFNIPVILNMHDVEHETILYFRKISTSIIKKIYYFFEYYNVVRMEKKAISTVARMVAVSERDKQCYLKKYSFGREKWIYANNGVDIRIAQNEQIVKREPATVLFLGSLKHPPNLHGLAWFVNNIWEYVLEQEQDAKLLVVGSGGITDEYKDMLSAKHRVEYLGYVENVYPLLRTCTCLVVPLLSGSGTRLKILEAFSFKTPVVSTTIGAEGIPTLDGKHLLIADQEIEMANKVLEIIHSQELGEQLAKNAYQIVCKDYDWDIIGKKFIKEIKNINSKC